MSYLEVNSVNLGAACSEGVNSLLTGDVSVFSYITTCWPQVSAQIPQCVKETSGLAEDESNKVQGL